MKIKVTESNFEALKKVLRTVERKATARTIGYLEVCHAAEHLERILNREGIPLKLRKGASSIIGHHTFPNAYKWIPEGTLVKLERGSSSWFMTMCFRGDCRGDDRLYFTEEQMTHLILKRRERLNNYKI